MSVRFQVVSTSLHHGAYRWAQANRPPITACDFCPTARLNVPLRANVRQFFLPKLFRSIWFLASRTIMCMYAHSHTYMHTHINKLAPEYCLCDWSVNRSWINLQAWNQEDSRQSVQSRCQNMDTIRQMGIRFACLVSSNIHENSHLSSETTFFMHLQLTHIIYIQSDQSCSGNQLHVVFQCLLPAVVTPLGIYKPFCHCAAGVQLQMSTSATHPFMFLPHVWTQQLRSDIPCCSTLQKPHNTTKPF